ncbi:MAG: MFS transporter [Dehalococcoidales bacterium]|nr:MFS transporter [Dehalococcoidales bacterium]
MKIADKTLQKIKALYKGYFPGLVPLFVLAHLMHHIPGFIIQPLMPDIRDRFGLDYYQAGWLTGAYTLSYGVSQLPGGWLGGRIAPRILITIGVAGVAFCGLLVGISPTYLFMVFALILMGILGGGYHPTASPLLADTIPVEKRGRALGVHQIGGTLANALVPLLAAGLAVWLTWRGFFALLTIPTIGYGIYLYFVLKKKNVGDKPHHADATTFSIHINPQGYIRRMTAFVTMGTAVQVFVFSTLAFIPLFVVDDLKEKAWLGSLLLSVGHIAGLLAGPIGGTISDRKGKIPVMLTVALASGPLIYLISLVHFWWLLPFLLLALGACMYVAMPVSESYVIGNASQRNRSTILGFYYFASRGGAGLLTPLIGKLADQYGFATAFTILGAALFVITLACSVFLWGHKD